MNPTTESKRDNSLKSLAIKPTRRAISVQPADLVKQSFLRPDSTLPLLIEPKDPAMDLPAWLRAQRDFIHRHLLRYGAILFRGFALDRLQDFEQTAAALDIHFMNYVEGATPRKPVRGKIYTSTEYPPEYKIALHNELSYVTTWPMKICFFCQRAAESGGETILADMRRVYRRIPEAIKTEFKQRQWRLVRHYGYGLGLSWQQSFGTTVKTELEAYCRRAQLNFQWLGDENLKTWCVRPAIHHHPFTREPMWFNHVVFWHLSQLSAPIRQVFENHCQKQAEPCYPYNTYYGDGAPIDADTIATIDAIYRQETIAEPWRNGDLLLLDNMLVAHGRNPFQGQRKVLVAMGDPARPSKAGIQ